jgi:hypothetical protein
MNHTHKHVPRHDTFITLTHSYTHIPSTCTDLSIPQRPTQKYPRAAAAVAVVVVGLLFEKTQQVGLT